MSPLWSVAVSVCRRSGLSPFQPVAVLTVAVLPVCRRFDSPPNRVIRWVHCCSAPSPFNSWYMEEFRTMECWQTGLEDADRGRTDALGPIVVNVAKCELITDDRGRCSCQVQGCFAGRQTCQHSFGNAPGGTDWWGAKRGRGFVGKTAAAALPVRQVITSQRTRCAVFTQELFRYTEVDTHSAKCTLL